MSKIAKKYLGFEIYEQFEVDTISGSLSDEIDSDIVTFSGTIDHNTIVNAHNLTIDIDHGSISGLTDDDHTQYILVDGTRGFTATVSGIIPTESFHLVTKEYADTLSGTGQTNTASNLGAGEGVYSTKVGVDLRFKSLIGGDNITLTSDSDTITISGSAGGGSGKNGQEAVTSGTSSVQVTFGSPFGDTNYSINTSLVNTADANPSQYTSTITAKSVNNFTASFSGDMDSGNYVLDWAALGGLGKNGQEAVTSGTSSVQVTFNSPFGDTTYSVNASLVNTTDANPSQYASTITAKSVSGFTASFSGDMDSGNYVLDWAALDLG